jgi:ATPase family associated with various cellular activities (AAA)
MSHDLRRSAAGESTHSWPFIRPSSEIRAWIPEPFRKAVLRHVLKNEFPEYSPSLLLAIQGGMGDGKSFQVRECCSQSGIFIVPLSGAALCGPYEGEPLSTLESIYVYASSLREATKSRVVVLIDDFDLSAAAAIGDRRYTVNTQLLSGFLMNLADDPTRCGEHHTARIPIILTGNNFTSLHGPLTRAGRMDFFNWTPSLEEKQRIVETMFSTLAPIDQLQIARLVRAYRQQPVSFFAALKGDLIDQTLMRATATEAVLDPVALRPVIRNALTRASADELTRLAEVRSKLAPQSFIR